MGDAVRLFEVSLRDGLQNESAVVPTAVKLRVLGALVASGLRDIEVTSFVRPDLLPQLADAAEVVAGLPRAEGVRFWALVPNLRGFERALAAGVRCVSTVLSASETHNRRNVNATVKESLAALQRVVADAKVEGLAVRSYVSTAFGCPCEGDVDTGRVADLALALRDAGADEIALGDTVGVGTPRQVVALVRRLVDAGLPIDALALHLHDTLGMAAANSWAAFEAGIRAFDGAVAGVGGCPYAAGAAGNAATQDLVYLFHQSGVPTGVDIDRLAEAASLLEGALGRDLPGRVHRWQVARRSAGRAARRA
jgi:hydroxymethylglutaryl-CoA lyase